MDKIPTQQTTSSGDVFEDVVLSEHRAKKKIAKSFFNYAGIVIGAFLMFAVVVIVTTDIRIVSLEQIAPLGLDFFLLLFCSYSMYINCSDSGMRAALSCKSYTDTLSVYESLKASVIERKMQLRLSEFCRYYTETELKNTRMEVLAVVGLTYEEYAAYLSKSKHDIMTDETLSAAQKKAIIRANSITPIKLTPEMILKRGRSSARRFPLGTKPETKRSINFTTKFASTIVVALLMSIIALDVVVEPTWAIFASCFLKLLTVVINGFGGYKFGYENIVIDTANYISDQTDLMRQAIQYIEAHP